MGLISRVSSRTYRYKMFTTVARRNAGQKALDVMIVRPHKFLVGKAGQYWANHGKHVKSELVPNPAAILGGIPAAAANTMAFGSASEKSSANERSSATIPETLENRWAPTSLKSSRSQILSLNPTSCANC